MQVLSGHYSAETAYVVNDYPYGFRLRCKIRYWLEVNSKGTRFWSQTTNPKKPIEVWNAPKASTYSLVGAMFLDDEGHTKWTGLSAYDVSKCREFLDTYGNGLTTAQITLLEQLAKGYESLQARKAAGTTLPIVLP
jgi:hypothetical protein